jgi:hypothetical protein
MPFIYFITPVTDLNPNASQTSINSSDTPRKILYHPTYARTFQRLKIAITGNYQVAIWKNTVESQHDYSLYLSSRTWRRRTRVRRCFDRLHCGEEEHLLDIYVKFVRPIHSSITSIIEHVLVESVRNITRRSMPIPHPPVGGRPCSSLSRSHVKMISFL